MDHEAIASRFEPIDYADETELASEYGDDLPPQPRVFSPARSLLASLRPAPMDHIPPQPKPLWAPQMPPPFALLPIPGPRAPPVPIPMHYVPAQRPSSQKRTIEAVDVDVASPVRDRAQYVSEVPNDGLTTSRKRRMPYNDSHVAPQPSEDTQSSVEQRHILTAAHTQQPDSGSYSLSSVLNARSPRVSMRPCRRCGKELQSST
jgi:hypothetical protein